MIGFTNALWTGCELLESQEVKKDQHIATVKLLQHKSPNDVLQSILPHVEILGLKEIIPSMNEIFIKQVELNNPKK